MPSPALAARVRQPLPAWAADDRLEEPVTSNVGQSYPYSSETEAERAARVKAIVDAHEGLGEKIAA